ncbi:MFS transporter [Saccharopolyspora karakumensis]|uniref:MFS transporter n=1 Tax=Saccharopolyspora karakumensis TaxID=2530386 RepID=A0A4R5BUC6_9PSEU|nr:MFS transporter [Saccharopolyspora karakumensis]TDD87784.1 MFS transporter [Saccharopolyspora karakumensis]
MPLALLALAVGAFGIGTAEFVMMGVLPQAAAELGVSIPTAGHLISGYALGVVVGAPALTILGARLPRKTMLVLTMGLFTAGNALFALAPSAGVGVALRFLAGLPHGAFFGAGAVVAASLAGTGSRAKAVSMMFMGLTLANVVGVPLGTLLGQQFGWRATFAVVAAIGVVAVAAIVRLVPDQGRPEPGQSAVLDQLAAFRSPQVWLALAIVTFGLGGTFACLSYLTPILTDVSGYSPTAVTLLLALAGLGMTVGNYLGGWIADKALMPGVYAALLGIAVVLGLFTLTSGNKVAAAVTVFAIGAVGFMVAPIMQALVMDKADGQASLVSAALQSAFNVANSIGAYAGGLVIAHGLGLLSPNLVGVLLSAVGLALAMVTSCLDRNSRREVPALEVIEGGRPAAAPQPVAAAA